MDFLVPASKIAGLQIGEFVGQIALDFGITEGDVESTMFHCRTELDNDAIGKEENSYFETPDYYEFESVAERNKILLANFEHIIAETKQVVAEVVNSVDNSD
jgi:hypothetical protein